MPSSPPGRGNKLFFPRVVCQSITNIVCSIIVKLLKTFSQNWCKYKASLEDTCIHRIRTITQYSFVMELCPFCQLYYVNCVSSDNALIC